MPIVFSVPAASHRQRAWSLSWSRACPCSRYLARLAFALLLIQVVHVVSLSRVVQSLACERVWLRYQLGVAGLIDELCANIVFVDPMRDAGEGQLTDFHSGSWRIAWIPSFFSSFFLFGKIGYQLAVFALLTGSIM